ncbi:hypothetical protein L9F63_013890 [Diploptera punctata]|uniref:Chitin-binding type-2 domain-containing protein n=1 Tax=Diploptera punctata TaxID=6984 RepID=A0AAD8EM08_DIPPU|nr:hypothetical protein L9F63_013890 [Diploptera punctata]
MAETVESGDEMVEMEETEEMAEMVEIVVNGEMDGGNGGDGNGGDGGSGGEGGGAGEGGEGGERRREDGEDGEDGSNGCPSFNGNLIHVALILIPGEVIYFPHPDSCEWFIQCSNGTPYCMPCPAGLHWNRRLSVCDWPRAARCVIR